MALQWISGYTDGNERIAEGQQLTHLHLYPRHPCQLLFLALYTHRTSKFEVLLGHELPALSDPSE